MNCKEFKYFTKNSFSKKKKSDNLVYISPLPTTFTVKLIFCLPATDTSLVPLWILPTLLFYYFPLTSFSHGETQKNLPVLIFFLFLFFPTKTLHALFCCFGSCPPPNHIQISYHNVFCNNHSFLA